MKAVHMQLDHALQTAAFPDKNLWQENCKHIMDLLTEGTKLNIQRIIRALLFISAFIWSFTVLLRPHLLSISDAITYQDNCFHPA